MYVVQMFYLDTDKNWKKGFKKRGVALVYAIFATILTVGLWIVRSMNVIINFMWHVLEKLEFWLNIRCKKKKKSHRIFCVLYTHDKWILIYMLIRKYKLNIRALTNNNWFIDFLKNKKQKYIINYPVMVKLKVPKFLKNCI